MTDSQKLPVSPDSMDSSLVYEFLLKNGINNSVVEQFKSHAIDCLSFGLITEQDLQEMKINQIGPRKRLLFLSSVWHSYMDKVYSPNFDIRLYRSIGDTMNTSKNVFSPNESVTYVPNGSANFNKSDDCYCQPRFLDSNKYTKENASQNFEILKLVISGIYFFLVTGITSFIMVLAHERLPDISKYPPLPDLFLDNLPHISWAFSAAEWVGVVLSIIWIIILIFHRYRCILLRRFFALTGTVFLLRSFTMIITSLSVPGQHLAEQCSPYVAKDKSQRIKRILEIWLGFGMTISGIQTCGDYMFSGHTSCLTLLNFFITEYAPRKYQFIHTFSWVLNLFGIFFILASHEHYSIDVFVAIYVSSRLFLYYHCLANSNILDLPDHERTMIWFPLFSFLEYDVRGNIPNVYEIPFRSYFNLQSVTKLSDGKCRSNHWDHGNKDRFSNRSEEEPDGNSWDSCSQSVSEDCSLQCRS